MNPLIEIKVPFTPRFDPFNQVDIGLEGSEGSGEILSRERERMGGGYVSRSKDDKAPGGISFPDLPVGEGITGPSPLIVNVRCHDPFQTISAFYLS